MFFLYDAKIEKFSLKTNLYFGKYKMKKYDFRQLRKNFTIFRGHILILQRVGYILFVYILWLYIFCVALYFGNSLSLILIFIFLLHDVRYKNIV